MSEQGPPQQKSNGIVSLLSTLAHSSDRWVQLGTLSLIALSGFGNWVATWNSADRNKSEIEISRRVTWEGEQRIREELIRQVKDIHEWMKNATDEFHKGNEDSANNRRTLYKISDELDDIQRRLPKGGP